MVTEEAGREASLDGISLIELSADEKLIDMLGILWLGLIPVKAYEIVDVYFHEFRVQ